jgi:hypothetical protein
MLIGLSNDSRLEMLMWRVKSNEVDKVRVIIGIPAYIRRLLLLTISPALSKALTGSIASAADES